MWERTGMQYHSRRKVRGGTLSVGSVAAVTIKLRATTSQALALLTGFILGTLHQLTTL